MQTYTFLSFKIYLSVLHAQKSFIKIRKNTLVVIESPSTLIISPDMF